MYKYKIFFMALLLASTSYASSRDEFIAGVSAVDSLSMEQLEADLEFAESELGSLAHYSLRRGIGSVGYRSDSYDTARNNEWIQIDLGQKQSIDQIVLVPCLWQDTKTGYRADCFPQEFSIFAGDGQETNLVAKVVKADNILPRIAPVVVEFSAISASWVRVEASLLTPRSFFKNYSLELAEVMVFSGQENVALQQPVKSSSGNKLEYGARKREYLVDGFVPYLMDAAQGNQSLAFVSDIEIGDNPVLTIDLGSIETLNRMHLHAVELTGSIPQSTPSGFGIPPRFVVEGALDPSFSDAVRLIEYHATSIYESGPIIMRRFPVTPCRYVRLTTIDPYIYSSKTAVGSLIGFAEIELFSMGRNVALGKPVQANFVLDSDVRSFAALTDGLNLYGKILPVREWIGELARRHDFEKLRPVIAAELNRRYAKQKNRLNRMSWLTMLLAAGIVLSIFIERLIHVKEMARMREKYAADLHDELGANIHAIGLLGDVALASLDKPERLKGALMNSRDLTERTGLAVRHCVNMQEAYGSNGNLRNDLERISLRILADLEYDISITGEEFLVNLKPRKSNEIFVFYKECLVNISRHSAATRVKTRLIACRKSIVLSVSDNGRGLSDDRKNIVPKSLRRRARLMGAKVQVEPLAGKGNCVILKLRTRMF